MNHHDRLQVHVDLPRGTALAGEAQFHRGRGRLSSTTFQYDSSYLTIPGAYALDPALELVSGTQHVQGLPGAFSDCAPDRWGRTLIEKRERAAAFNEHRRAASFDEVDFLAAVSDATRQGALRFRQDAGGESPFVATDTAIPALIQLPTLLRAAEASVREGIEGLNAVKTLLAAGTGSLGGARPKASVIDRGRLMIAKFPHHDDAWDVMAWEGTALDIAQLAGIRVATHQLTRVDDRHLLLLDRFDREGGDGRIGYMSAMTLLEHRDGETADYVDIAERLTEVSVAAKDDRRQLFLRAALNVGLNNTDDHLRNHGFLRANAGWVLSPAFDINPNPRGELRQTTIAGADAPADEAEGLVELAKACRLAESDAHTALAEVIGALDRWRDAARKNGVPSEQIAYFQETFDAGVDTVNRAHALTPSGITSRRTGQFPRR